MSTLWDTTGGEIVKALAAERRSAGAVTSGLVLSLVVVADENRVGAATESATAAAAAHPCRLLVVVRRQPDAPTPRLDAEVQVGGRLGAVEAVVMRMYGRLSLHAESVVLPLLAPDAPVVTWWAGAPPERIAHEPLGVLADRRVTDCSQSEDPLGTLRQRAEDYSPGDTDLAWARVSQWRSVLASAFDSGPGTAEGVTVAAGPGSASGALLGGWLGSRLGVPVETVEKGPRGLASVTVSLRSGDGPVQIEVSRRDARTGVLSRTGHPDRSLPLERRQEADLLSEELRRLDADQPYGEALATAFGLPVDRVAERRTRTHIWKDALPA